MLTGSGSDPSYSKERGSGKWLIPYIRPSTTASYSKAGNKDLKEAVVVRASIAHKSEAVAPWQRLHFKREEDKALL